MRQYFMASSPGGAVIFFVVQCLNEMPWLFPSPSGVLIVSGFIPKTVSGGGFPSPSGVLIVSHPALGVVPRLQFPSPSGVLIVS